MHRKFKDSTEGFHIPSTQFSPIWTHKVLYAVIVLLVNSKYILISIKISSLSHEIFKSTILNCRHMEVLNNLCPYKFLSARSNTTSDIKSPKIIMDLSNHLVIQSVFAFIYFWDSIIIYILKLLYISEEVLLLTSHRCHHYAYYSLCLRKHLSNVNIIAFSWLEDVFFILIFSISLCLWVLSLSLVHCDGLSFFYPISQCLPFNIWVESTYSEYTNWFLYIHFYYSIIFCAFSLWFLCFLMFPFLCSYINQFYFILLFPSAT